MSFKKFAFPVFVLAIAGTLVALIQPAYVAERWSPLTVRAPIADPAPVPCKQQSSRLSVLDGAPVGASHDRAKPLGATSSV
jgi:hypothetical protein